jgi:alpha-1,6-mannosyltransferase
VNGPSVLAGAPSVQDPVYAYTGAKWINTPSVYGPLFTLLSALFAGPKNISPSGIAASVYAFKLVAASCCLGTLALLWAGCQRRGLDGTRAIALFGLNPLVIVYGVGGGHNDLLTVLLSTAAVYAVLVHRPRSGGGLISMATMVKLTAGLTLPFAMAAGGLGAAGRRRSLLVGAGVAAGVLMAIGFAVFGTSLLQLPITLDHVQNMGEGQTLPGFVSTVLRINWLGHLIGLLQGAAFVAVCAWLLRRVARGQMDWIDGAAWATFGVLVSTSSILPWYVSWLLPLVALATTRRLWTVALCFSGWVLLTTLLAYIPHGQTILGVG